MTKFVQPTRRVTTKVAAQAAGGAGVGITIIQLASPFVEQFAPGMWEFLAMRPAWVATAASALTTACGFIFGYFIKERL